MTYHDVIGTHYLRDINHDFALQDACLYSQRIMGEAHVLNVIDMAVRWGLAQGQPNREQIALTMSRVLAQEMEYASSPAGVLTRARERVADKLPGGDGSGEQ